MAGSEDKDLSKMYPEASQVCEMIDLQARIDSFKGANWPEQLPTPKKVSLGLFLLIHSSMNL
jgi:hypothetical protein